jgi:hypothetical protein
VDWFEAVRDRVVPASGDVALAAPRLLIVLGIALVLVAVEPLWRVVRLAVTLVHELGHAVVGVLVGRQFTGFVLRGDMSGHAVTRGPVRGPGRMASTWSGYPMPALLGAAMVWAAERGWAAPVITAGLAVLLFALVRVRSALTVVVMLVAIAGSAALWWWRDDALQTQVLVGLGVVLVVGAWRHLLADVPATCRLEPLVRRRVRPRDVGRRGRGRRHPALTGTKAGCRWSTRRENG